MARDNIDSKWCKGVNCNWVSLKKSAASVLLTCAWFMLFTATVRAEDPDIAELEDSVAYLMSLPADDMLAIVPSQSSICYTDCPNCDQSSQDYGNFSWSPERPGEIVCSDCGEKYPDNPDYPDPGFIEVAGPNEPHVYHYYERPSDNYRIYFRARADYFAREYMAKKCSDFADLYRLTNDETYAERAAAILVRFAEVYPGYAFHYDYPFAEKLFAPYNDFTPLVPATYRTAKWSWWAYMDISVELVHAYDCLKDYTPLESLADGTAIEMIEDDLIGAMVEFVLSIPESYTNMSPVFWNATVYAGQVLDKWEWIDEIVTRLEYFMDNFFLHDGFWMETTFSYGGQVVNMLENIMNNLKAYQPPPEDQEEYNNRIQLLESSVNRIKEMIMSARFPDGRVVPVNDTWHWDRREARSSMDPVLLPGFGLGVLGSGTGEEQLHCYLNFTTGSGHKHLDNLSMGMFAFGKELFSDIGYTHTKYRKFANNTMSHNTVSVNGLASQFAGAHGSELRFFTTADGLQCVQAQSNGAYPGITSRYRRTLILVGAGSADSYLIDVFEVTGGHQHDYLIAGSADEDSTLTANVPTESFAGTLMNPEDVWREPTGYTDPSTDLGFGFWKALRRSKQKTEITFDAAAHTYTRTFPTPINMNGFGYLYMNYFHADPAAFMPDLTVKLLDSSDAVLVSDALPLDDGDEGTWREMDIDISNITGIKKMVVEVDGSAGSGTFEFQEIGLSTPKCVPVPAADLDNNCRVNLADLVIFAAEWLDCNLFPEAACQELIE